ncbi:phosphotransferase [Spelaeicoccus albus]|uniref:Aminoglycoside phosphotransferase domain-containing protein n=1 Tax=Spelaeicoccus albus TaxID=1280376 RepID=A0A7Z0II36_9MICO|nr:phosphotransferase [Spelaeicoccus albus]NYI68104.1 hypothetical protein [Spelaeicoccus albus]
MSNTSLRLAALSTAAVPGFAPTTVRMQSATADSVSAVLADDAHRELLIHVALTPMEALRGDAERSVLDVFTPAMRNALPFALPKVVGRTGTGDVGSLRLDSHGAADPFAGKGKAYVYEPMAGTPIQLSELTSGPDSLAASLGRAIAAIHELDPATARETGLPDYDAEDYRHRRLAELDQAAETGKVPPRLLQRWEEKLENVGLWRFQPCINHGELSEDRVLARGTAIQSITGWAQTRIADPADDLSWLIAAAEPDAVDTIFEAYAGARAEPPSPQLRERAELLSELALAGWLLYGVSLDDDAIIHDGEAMLVDLDEHLFASAGSDDAHEDSTDADSRGAGDTDDEPDDPDDEPDAQSAR